MRRICVFAVAVVVGVAVAPTSASAVEIPNLEPLAENLSHLHPIHIEIPPTVIPDVIRSRYGTTDAAVITALDQAKDDEIALADATATEIRADQQDSDTLKKCLGAAFDELVKQATSGDAETIQVEPIVSGALKTCFGEAEGFSGVPELLRDEFAEYLGRRAAEAADQASQEAPPENFVIWAQATASELQNASDQSTTTTPGTATTSTGGDGGGLSGNVIAIIVIVAAVAVGAGVAATMKRQQ